MQGFLRYTQIQKSKYFENETLRNRNTNIIKHIQKKNEIKLFIHY